MLYFTPLNFVTLSKESSKGTIFSLYRLEEVSVRLDAVKVPLDDVIVTPEQEYAIVPEPFVYAAPHKAWYAVPSDLFGK